MDTEVMFSSATDEWMTDPLVWAGWDNEFHFTLDVAATPKNALCRQYFTMEDDALKQDWGGQRCWMNPPYSLGSAFVQKAFEESQKKDTIVVGLLPSRTDTKWFHRYVWNKYESAPREGVQLRLLEGRLKFSLDLLPHIAQVQHLARTAGPKAIAQMMHLPLTAVRAAMKNHTILRESAPFPSLLVVWGQKETMESLKRREQR